MILETERLYLRELCQNDFAALCAILQDSAVMYAYEHAFSDQEVQIWLDRQRRRYRDDGFGLWAAVLKKTGDMIGQCGITLQEWDGRQVPEIGYLFAKAYWRKGYAVEAAEACKNYAFDTLGYDRVYSIIRENNIASRKVAEKNGMTVCGAQNKFYYGMDMPHVVYAAENPRAAGRPDNE